MLNSRSNRAALIYLRHKCTALAKAILSIALSPLLFTTYVKVARTIGVLRDSVTPPPGTINTIFISSAHNFVGDLVFLMPLFEVIRETWPKAKIHVAVGASLAPFIEQIPHIDKVFACPVAARDGVLPWRLRELRGIISCYEREISRYSYDIAFVPRWGSDVFAIINRYLMYLTNARRRCAYSATVDGGSYRLDRLLTDAAYGGEIEHESVRCVRMLERLNLVPTNTQHIQFRQKPSMTLKAIAAGVSGERVERLLSEATGRLISRYVIIAPGATKATHLWPIERFAAVMAKVATTHGLEFLIVGVKAEISLCKALAATLPGRAFSIAGKTTLQELAAILQNASLFIGNDSGPGHLAAGLGVPCISINPFPLHADQSHRDSSLRCRPSGPVVFIIQPDRPLPPCKVACGRKDAHCITQVSAKQVLLIAESLLSEEK